MSSNSSETSSPVSPKLKNNLPLRLGVIALGLVVLWLFTSLQGGNLLSAGTKAPEWSLDEPNSSRRSLSLSDLKGKVVVFDFWSLGCPPCMQMVPELNAVSKQFAGKDVAVVGVSAWGENRHDVFRMKRSRNLDYHLLVGTPEVVQSYKVSSLPTLYIIDKDGNVARTHQGYWSRKELAEAVQEVLD